MSDHRDIVSIVNTETTARLRGAEHPGKPPSRLFVKQSGWSELFGRLADS